MEVVHWDLGEGVDGAHQAFKMSQQDRKKATKKPSGPGALLGDIRKGLHPRCTEVDDLLYRSALKSVTFCTAGSIGRR
jgi:hypothetical protein